MKPEAAFWKDRYDTQHRTLHDLEEKLIMLRAAVDDLALWEPGRRGYAQAFAKLMKTRNGG